MTKAQRSFWAEKNRINPMNFANGVGGITFHGRKCSDCALFTSCIKNPAPDQDYCALPSHKFQKKEEIHGE